MYSALEVQAIKERPDDESSVKDARADTETFAVANFVYRRRNALRWFVNLEAIFESGTRAAAPAIGARFPDSSTPVEEAQLGTGTSSYVLL